MPNPETDIVHEVIIDGKPLTIVHPGEKLRGTRTNDAWRRDVTFYKQYEPLIEQAVSAWENGRHETSFPIPPNTAPSTFCARFRDAILALETYGYNPDLQSRVVAIRQEISITLSPDGKLLWFTEKQKKARKHFRPVSGQSPSGLHSDPVIERALATDELHAFCLLLTRKLRTSPVIFRGKIDPVEQTFLEAHYDVAFIFDDSTSTTTII